MFDSKISEKATKKNSSCNKELNDFVVDDSTADTIKEFAYLNVNYPNIPQRSL